MDEFELIRRIVGEQGKPARGVRVGPGDDAAVVRPPVGVDLVLSVDAQIEGTHFRRAWLTPRDIGYRAAMASVSDLAAMGAKPWIALVNGVLPHDMPARDTIAIHRGMDRALAAVGARSVGGNLATAAHGPALTVTVVGTVERGADVRRGRSLIGDTLWISGTPGAAALGLCQLEAGERSGHFVRAFRRPEARVALGRALGRKKLARSMIDVSDGLTQDLTHLLGPTRGALLNWKALAPSAAFERKAVALGADPGRLVLGGGDDYELLFAAAPEQAARIRRVAGETGVRLREIGSVTRHSGIRLDAGDGETMLEPRGYRH